MSADPIDVVALALARAAGQDDEDADWWERRAEAVVAAMTEAGLLPSADLRRDIIWLARLARGSSWPGEMAERVEATAARVIAWTHGGPAGGEGR